MAQVRPALGNGGSTSWEIHRCYPNLELSGYLIWTISSNKLGSWSSWPKTFFHKIGSSLNIKECITFKTFVGFIHLSNLCKGCILLIDKQIAIGLWWTCGILNFVVSIMFLYCTSKWKLSHHLDESYCAGLQQQEHEEVSNTKNKVTNVWSLEPNDTEWSRKFCVI